MVVILLENLSITSHPLRSEVASMVNLRWYRPSQVSATVTVAELALTRQTYPAKSRTMLDDHIVTCKIINLNYISLFYCQRDYSSNTMQSVQLNISYFSTSLFDRTWFSVIWGDTQNTWCVVEYNSYQIDVTGNADSVLPFWLFDFMWICLYAWE